MIHVVNCGYKNLTDLYRGDRQAWKFVKLRGLEDQVFEAFQHEQK